MADDLKKNTSTSTPVVPIASDASDDPWKDVREEIRQRFELLPEEIQKVVTGAEYQETLFGISKAQKLSFEELGILEVETTMALLGMTKPEEFRDELQVQLKKNDAEIDTLVQTVTTQVFEPIRALIEKVYAEQKEPEDYLSENPNAKPALTATPMPAPATTPIAAPLQAAAPKVTVPPIPMPELSGKDKNVLEKTGVVITETTPAASRAEPSLMLNRNDLLMGIENPQKTSKMNLVADKLKTAAPVIAPTKTTDYSVAKATPVPTPPPATPASSPKTNDPYREPIG